MRERRRSELDAGRRRARRSRSRREPTIGFLALTKVLFREYPRGPILGATLMITQSFLYNAIFFTYTLVLTKFYDVAGDAAPAITSSPSRSATSPGR